MRLSRRRRRRLLLGLAELGGGLGAQLLGLLRQGRPELREAGEARLRE